MVMFDSSSLVINPNPAGFAAGLLPPTEARRTRDDEPSKADSVEWYARSEQNDDPSDPAGWDDIDLRAEQAEFEDMMACGFYPA